MTKVFTLDTVRSVLTQYIATHGTKTAALHCGVGVQFLRDVQQGKRPPSDKVLAALGLAWGVVPRDTIPTEVHRA